MSRDGNGQYSLPTGNPVVTGTVIESTWANSTMQDIAQALSTSIAYDGQTIPVNNLPMGNFHHTGVSDPSQRNQYLSLGMAQDGNDKRIIIQSGVNDLSGTLVGSASSYSAGQVLTFQALATNTGPMTINVNGIGAREINQPDGSALLDGNVVEFLYYLVFYTGTEFRLMNPSIVGGGSSREEQSSITGSARPTNGLYPELTVFSGTTIAVPAGTGLIVPPGPSPTESSLITEVSWGAQNVVLMYRPTAFSTTLAVDSGGNIVQLPDAVLNSSLRNYIVLGTAIHVNGTVTEVISAPAIYGDDGYLFRDLTRLVSGMLLSGGTITQSAINALAMDVGAGAVFLPGGNANAEDSPNVRLFGARGNIFFYPLAGESTKGTLTNIAPVVNYDPNFSGTITAIPGGAAASVIHRLYFLNDVAVWQYGQRVYATLAEAKANLAYDRALFKVSTHLAGATFICEVIASKSCLAIGDSTTCAIVPRGGFEFVIGSSGGMGEAPQDGTPYGRQNAAWVSVLGSATPNVTGNVQITKSDPRVVFKESPVGSLWAGLSFTRADNTQRYAVRVNPDSSFTITSHNAGGTLVSTTTLANDGTWTFPGTAVLKQLNFNTGQILSGGGSLDTDLIIRGGAGDFIQLKPDNGAVTYVINNGGIEIPIAPTLDSHAATKRYVDIKKEALPMVALGDEVTPVPSGASVKFRMPYAFYLSNVKASLNVAQVSGALFTIDVFASGVSILSTKLTFTNGSKTTVGAVAPPVISDKSLADDEEIEIRVTQIGNGTAVALKVSLIGCQGVLV